MKKYVLRFFILILAATLMVPTTAQAAVSEPLVPMASDYIDNYGSYCYATGNGNIEIWFYVLGTGVMDKIGCQRIYLYESIDGQSWSYVTSFFPDEEPDMMGHNVFYYRSCVSYQGVAGRVYKAHVSIWAGKDGGGDARPMWTAAELAR